MKPTGQYKLVLAFFLFVLLVSLFACREKEKVYDVVVVGGGLMGSSAAWHLSQEMDDLLLLEKQGSVYQEGSSLGETRIARSSNRGSDIWSYLHNRSVAETKKLVSFLNTIPEDETSIDQIYTTSPVTYVGQERIYDRLYSSLIRQNIEYDLLTDPKEASDEFDIDLPEGILLQREYNHLSGTINPEELIQLLHRAIKQQGGSVRYNHHVEMIEKRDEYYYISMTHLGDNSLSTVVANHVVSAAGPYTSSLLSDLAPYLDSLIRPQRVFLAFLGIENEAYLKLTEEQRMKLNSFYPVINSSTGTRDGSFFSMLEGTKPNGSPLIKIGGHFQRSAIQDLDEVWKKELSPQEIEWSLSSTSRYMDLLRLPVGLENLEFIKGYSCVYSLTSTEVPYVTPLHTIEGDMDPNFIIMGGMSGVGAKGAMTYGLIAANQLFGYMDSDTMYMAAASAMGYDRLVGDLYPGQRN